MNKLEVIAVADILNPIEVEEWLGANQVTVLHVAIEANIFYILYTEDRDNYARRLRDLDWRFGERMLTSLLPDQSLVDATTYVGIASDTSLAVDPAWTILRSKYDSNGKMKMQALMQNLKWTDRETTLYPGDGTRAFGTITYIEPTIPVAFNIFENDVYPEDYGWSGELTANQLVAQLSNFVNAVWGGTVVATVTDNVLTVTMKAVGVAGNANIMYSSNLEGAVTSGQFTGGTDPE